MSQAIIVRCPECQRRCQVRTKETSFKVRCKRCDAPIQVPAQADLAKRTRSAEKSRSTEKKTKGSVSRERNRSANKSSRLAPTSRRERSTSRQNNSVPVQCPQCNTSFSATESDYGNTIFCPLCNASIDLPDPFASTREMRTRRSSRKKKAPNLVEGEIAPAPRERKDKMPKGIMLYIDGVLSFPFQPEVIFRLLTFSFLIFLLDAIVDACIYSLFNFIYALRGFGISALLMFLMVGSYAAVTFQTIFEETAAGSKEVKGWIEFDKSEYAFRLFTIGWIFSISAVIGYMPIFLVNLAFKFGDLSFLGDFPINLILFPLGFLLCLAAFPFIALSTFEQHSFFAIFSGRVFKSLFREWWSWGIVIIVTWGFFLPWIVLRMMGGIIFPFRAILILSPYFAVIFFIYSRLLGRLAYKIAQSADWD